MKRKRILSLLLALTVMATMLMAVPLTGYAADSPTVDDLTPIPSTVTSFNIADYISTGVTISASSLTPNGYFLWGSTYGTKGNTVKIAGTSYKTEWIVKQNVATDSSNFTKRAFAFKVENACTVKLYSYYNGNPVHVAVNYDSNGNAMKTVTSKTSVSDDDNSYDLTTVEVDAGDVIYVGGNGTNEAYIAQIDFEYPSTDAGITLDSEKTLYYNVSKTLDLGASIENGQDGYYIGYVSSDTDVVTVDTDGKVTAQATSGTATITAKLYDSSDTIVQVEGVDVTATCDVTISNADATTGVSVSSDTSNYYVGGTYTLTATVEPSGATQEVTWTSSDETVATVKANDDLTTATLTCKTTGTTTITATAVDGTTYSGTLTVDVTTAPMVTPSSSGGVGDLVTAPIGTTLYDLVKEADDIGAVVGLNSYEDSGLYFDDQVYVYASGGDIYSLSKTATNIDGTTYDHAYRVKGVQFYFAVKLAPGATVSTYANLGNITDGRGVYILSGAPSGTASDNESAVLASVVSGNGIVSYTNPTDEDEKTVYITALNSDYSSGGDSYITQIQVDVPEPDYEFGDLATDSGYYNDSEGQTLGVIRFLQEFTTNTDTTGYGFYFVDSEDGGISSALGSVSASGSAADYSGFYTDLTDIPEGNFGTTYYALPFVTYNVADGTSEGTTGYEYGTTTISGTVNAGTAITDYIYSDWKTGGDAYNDDGSVNGSTSVTTTDDGVTALKIASKNAYYTFDEAISSGTVTFSTDAYVPDTTSKLFRIHLENTSATEISNSSNVFAEALSIVEGSAWVGPVVKANDNSGTNVGSYTETGWYHIEVVIDYDSYTGSTEDKFITINVTSPSGDTVVDTTIGSNSVDGGTTLNQIRLDGISADQYFANMSISVTE